MRRCSKFCSRGWRSLDPNRPHLNSIPECFEALCELPVSLQNSLGGLDISTLPSPASCSIRLLPGQSGEASLKCQHSALHCPAHRTPPLHFPGLPVERRSEVSPSLHPRENPGLVLLESLKVPPSQTFSTCPPRTHLGKEEDSSGLIKELDSA